MKINRISRLLCGGLAAVCWVQSLALPVWAEEAAGTEPTVSVEVTEPVETAAPTEVTIPVQTTPPTEATVPAQTTPPTEESFPEESFPEETVAPTEATLPTETTATQPVETTSPTETVPEETTPENFMDPLTSDAPLTVPQALELPEDYGMPFFVRGFVIYSDPSLLILQDGPYGLAMISTGKTAETGQAATVRCLKTKSGLTLREVASQEPAEAPQILETTLAQAPEHRLIRLCGLVYQDGTVSQEGTSYSLAGRLPQDLPEGGVLDATAVRHGPMLYLLQWENDQPEAEKQPWYPVPLEQKPSLDSGILTITDSQGQTFALSRTPEQGFTTLPIDVENGQAQCPAGNTEWKIASNGNRISFMCPQGWLSCQTAGIFLSPTPDFWQIREGYLYHPSLGMYLVATENGFAAEPDHQTTFAGQQAGIWSSQPLEPPKPERPEFPGGLRPYFGQLHIHSQTSDGKPLHQVYASGREAGLDFLAVTDPSKSIGSTAKLANGRKAAQQCSSQDFLALYGCEMTTFPTQHLGHITTLGTETLPKFDVTDLKSYYEILAALPGSISQFSHPGPYWGEFESFSDYDRRYDNVLHLLEVDGEEMSGQPGWSRHYYDMALEKGWHVAPTNNCNNHADLFQEEFQGRTVILATALTEQALAEAIRARRVYASEDRDLSLYYSVNGQSMGAVLAPAERYTLELLVEDPTDGAGASVEVIGKGGAKLGTYPMTDGHLTLTLPKDQNGYYYLQLTQEDGDRVLTAPVWIPSLGDWGIQEFTGPEKAMVDVPAELRLTLYNQEEMPVEVSSITLNGQAVEDPALPVTISSGETKELALTYTCTQPGAVKLKAVVDGTVGGVSKTREKSMTLFCWKDPQQEQEGLPQEVTALKAVRTGEELKIYRVRGYVTAGTDNPHNRFPESLYIQDDTGGIQVTAFQDAGISVGTPLEIVGVRKYDGQNPVLELLEYEILQQDSYRYVPKTMACSAAMNGAVHGGRLLQVEGKVRQLHPTANSQGISWLEIEDIRGERARILIEPYIKAGSTGENDLAKDIRLGRTVRAMGLCHLDETGTWVLRVRNCEEVVYVPPLPDPSNPKTEDAAAKILAWLGR